jgi:hypothetical protein
VGKGLNMLHIVDEKFTKCKGMSFEFWEVWESWENEIEQKLSNELERTWALSIPEKGSKTMATLDKRHVLWTYKIRICPEFHPVLTSSFYFS